MPPSSATPMVPLVTLHTSETETRAPLATEIYGHKGALVQVRGDHPSTKLDFGDPATLMLYTRETEAWQPLSEFHRSFVPTGIQRVRQILRRLGQRGGDADHDV